MSRQKQKARPLGYGRCIAEAPTINSLNITKLIPGQHTNSEKFKESVHEDVINDSSANEDNKEMPRPVCEQPPTGTIVVRHSDPPQRTVTSHDKCQKKIDDGLKRERNFMDQIEVLEKQLEELKVTLCSKEEETRHLKTQLENQEAQFTAQLHEEKMSHEVTQGTLHKTTEKLTRAQESIQRILQEHKKETEKCRIESERHLVTMMSEKDLIIVDRDQRLARLKAQMAEALKGNSWERQQQLDELTKELSRMQDENHVLKMTIKSKKNHQQGQCPHCKENHSALSKLQTAIKERDVTIKELQLLCRKFETRLTT